MKSYIKKSKEIKESWKDLLCRKVYPGYIKAFESFKHIDNHIEKYFPEIENIFKAFTFFDLSETRVVIIGQDPYKHKGQANGLSFSITRLDNSTTRLDNSTKIPPSLRNIFKEMNNSGYPRTDPNFSDLAKQGVLWMNSILTLEPGKTMSHSKIKKSKNYPGAWEFITTRITYYISKKNTNCIFVLWGKYAENLFEYYIKTGNSKAIILKSSHPSPLSCRSTSTPFLGSKCFKKINELLSDKQIKWNN